MIARHERCPRNPPPSGLRRNLTSYGDPGFSLFLRKAFIKAAGFSDDALDRPIVGITNTFSDFNPCHGNVPRLIEAVKRGVMLAGGLPMEFPTISIHESFASPTSMFLRNLMAMDTEEMIRAQPMDAVVLIGGCDKTVPAQLMAAVSADVPAIQLITGPMLVGLPQGRDARSLHRLPPALGTPPGRRHGPGRGGGRERASRSDPGHLHGHGHGEHHGLPRRGAGHCAAGDRLDPGDPCGPDPGRRGQRHARRSRWPRSGPRPSELLTEAAFRNAMVVLQAIGGSTNGSSIWRLSPAAAASRSTWRSSTRSAARFRSSSI